MKRVFLLASTLLLGACSMVPYYPQLKAMADTGIVTAVQDRKEFNDKRLAVNLAVLCDSSIGSVMRYPNAEVRDFVTKLCGGEPGLTMDQFQRVVTLLDQVTHPENAPEPLAEPEPEALPPLPEDFQ